MSRIGKQPITIPEKTDITVEGTTVTVKGPLGTLSRTFTPNVAIVKDGDTVVTKPANNTRLAQALWGTYASHIRNMVAGVTTAYEKKLVVEGVGYKVDVQGSKLMLTVGFSHPVTVEIPEGLTVTNEKNTITISGIDKELVGHFAAKVRMIKKPEPYKGKGIRYDDEVVRRKQGKKAAQYMTTTHQKKEKRNRRHARIRTVIRGTASRPRLSVFKSNTALYAQLIDDDAGKTLAQASSRTAKGATPMEKAAGVGATIAEAAKALKITGIVFDRGGFLYTGRIKALADAAREAGLTF